MRRNRRRVLHVEINYFINLTCKGIANYKDKSHLVVAASLDE